MQLNKLRTRLKIKNRGLFDHVKEIKENQDKNYYNNLNEEEIKSFNKYMILRVLSMNKERIKIISELSKYQTDLSNELFYKLLISKLQKDYKFYKYIKKNIAGINGEVIDSIKNWYNIGYKDAMEYYKIFISNINGLEELLNILLGMGYTEKDIDRLFK